MGLLVLLKLPKTTQRSKSMTWYDIFSNLDPIGTTIFVPCVICLLLALQWGGTTYAWSNYRIIVCLVFFATMLLTFVAVQWFLENKATIPVRIPMQRSIAFGSVFIFCLGE